MIYRSSCASSSSSASSSESDESDKDVNAERFDNAVGFWSISLMISWILRGSRWLLEQLRFLLYLKLNLRKYLISILDLPLSREKVFKFFRVNSIFVRKLEG